MLFARARGAGRKFKNPAILSRVAENSHNARYWIETLQLKPHPEGGHYRQTYKSELTIPGSSLPAHWGPRAVSTAIYFLIDGRNFSAFHRLRSDEVWHFYAGSPLLVHVLDPAGTYSALLLGNDPDAGQLLQAVVPAESWFASHVADWTAWALVGCTVAPGFELADFEIARREDLSATYPKHRQLIARLTRDEF
ncbi:MAG TPA: cupin domain-containing protein [Candidatus Binatia bacterium]|nr:cupin domain-containing protein [Candidatus Binatia bacterium]